MQQHDLGVDIRISSTLVFAVQMPDMCCLCHSVMAALLCATTIIPSTNMEPNWSGRVAATYNIVLCLSSLDQFVSWVQV